MIRKRRWMWALFLLLGAAALVVSGCSKKETEAAARAAVPVTIGTVAEQNVPVQIRAIGNVEALSTVTIKSMVAGEITEVHFKEGQDVRRGDMLFSIDQRPYQAALSQAQANLARDTAMLKQSQANLTRDSAQAANARAEAKRYEDLFGQGVISRQVWDEKHTSLEAADATLTADHAAIDNAQAAIHADEAAVENATINLGYCSIRSPIDGRTGSLAAFRGQIVKSNDTVLVTLNQVTPIYVGFAVPQQYLADIKKYSASGSLRVQAVISNNFAQPEQGVLTFIDNSVDAQTGTIKLKGTFPNGDRRLWPGQFVDAVLTLTVQPGAIVVPSQALQNSQAGQFAYVVKADNTVESRPVLVGRTVGNTSVIEKGLQPGERVVTDGQLRLVPGAKVTELKGGPQDAPASPQSKDSRL
jgi:multidrug efflux system membrane fusion protein